MASKLLGINPVAAKPFAAFVADEETRTAALQAAADAGIGDPQVAVCKLDDMLRALRKMSTPKLLVVDLAGSPDPTADLTRLSEVCDEGTQVVAVGDVNDINLYRSLIGFGVSDYFPKPVSADALAAALTNVGRDPTKETTAAQVGQVISIVGARGGVGATSIAVNVAWLLANEHKRRVALVDLDLFFGSCGLALDLELGRGFREALENPSRIDGLFIERAMVASGDNLFVLSAEESLENTVNFDASAVELLIDHLRRDFQHVIVDLPRFAARTQASLLTPPSAVAIVSDASLAGMRDTMRLSGLLKKIAPKADLKVVLNQVGAHAATELGAADFEKGAETRIGHLVPYDPKAFGASSSTGKPMPKIAAGSRATKALRALCNQFVTVRPAKTKAPILRRLLGAGA
jgi:pilus assembly protein CpaE